MPLIQGNEATLHKLVSGNPRVILFYYREDCTLCMKLLEDFKRQAESKFYKDIMFIAINTPARSSTGNLISREQTPYFESYHKGVLVDFQSIETKNELLYIIRNIVMQDT